MNTAIRVCLITSILMSGAWIHAGQETSNERPYIGILLEPLPAREIFAEHLGLAPDQGLIIRNVQTDSPADKAGLERNDILIAFNGMPLRAPDQFIEAVQDAGVGKEVSLEIIHQGKRKEVNVKLESYKGNDEWEYPFDDGPQNEFLSPGMVLKRKLGEQAWQEFPVNRPFREVYCYTYTEGSNVMTVTIEGNPQDGNTPVTVTAGDEKYERPAAKIDELPEPFVARAKESLENARRLAKDKPLAVPSEPFIVKPSPDWGLLNRQFQSVQPPVIVRPKDNDRLQRRMDELESRLERLEQQKPEGPQT